MPIHSVTNFTGKQLIVKEAGLISERVQLPLTMQRGSNFIITKDVDDSWKVYNGTGSESVEDEAVTFVDGEAELAKKVANLSTLHITTNAYEKTEETENNTCEELTLSDYRWCTDSQINEWKAKKIVGVTSVKIADIDVPTDDYYIGVGAGFDHFLFVKAAKQSEYTGKTATAVVVREGAEEAETLTLKNLSNSLWILPVATAGNPELLQCINRSRSNREERVWLSDGTSVGPGNRDGDGFFDGAKILAIPGGDIASNHGDSFYLKYTVSEESRELDPDEFELDDDRKMITLAEGVEVPEGAVADYIAGDICDEIAIVDYNDQQVNYDRVFTAGVFYETALDNWNDVLALVQTDIVVK